MILEMVFAHNFLVSLSQIGILDGTVVTNWPLAAVSGIIQKKIKLRVINLLLDMIPISNFEQIVDRLSQQHKHGFISL